MEEVQSFIATSVGGEKKEMAVFISKKDYGWVVIREKEEGKTHTPIVIGMIDGLDNISRSRDNLVLLFAPLPEILVRMEKMCGEEIPPLPSLEGVSSEEALEELKKTFISSDIPDLFVDSIYRCNNLAQKNWANWAKESMQFKGKTLSSLKKTVSIGSGQPIE